MADGPVQSSLSEKSGQQREGEIDAQLLEQQTNRVGEMRWFLDHSVFLLSGQEWTISTRLNRFIETETDPPPRR